LLNRSASMCEPQQGGTTTTATKAVSPLADRPILQTGVCMGGRPKKPVLKGKSMKGVLKDASVALRDDIPVIEVQWNHSGPCVREDGTAKPPSRVVIEGVKYVQEEGNDNKGSYGMVWKYVPESTIATVQGITPIALKCVVQKVYRTSTVDARSEVAMQNVASKVCCEGVTRVDPVLGAAIVKEGSREMIFMATRFLVGKDLRVLAKGDHYSAGTLRRVMRQVGETLVEMHHAGIVHGDMKVANVFIDQDKGKFVGKIGDYGLSGLLSSPLHVGSASYMGLETVDFIQSKDRAEDHNLGIMIALARTLIPKAYKKRFGGRTPTDREAVFQLLLDHQDMIYQARDTYSFGIMVACAMCRNSGSSSLILQLQGLPQDATSDEQRTAKLRGLTLQRDTVLRVLLGRGLSEDVAKEVTDVVIKLTNPSLEDRWSIAEVLQKSSFFSI